MIKLTEHNIVFIGHNVICRVLAQEFGAIQFQIKHYNEQEGAEQICGKIVVFNIIREVGEVVTARGVAKIYTVGEIIIDYTTNDLYWVKYEINCTEPFFKIIGTLYKNEQPVMNLGERFHRLKLDGGIIGQYKCGVNIENKLLAKINTTNSVYYCSDTVEKNICMPPDLYVLYYDFDVKYYITSRAYIIRIFKWLSKKSIYAKLALCSLVVSKILDYLNTELEGIPYISHMPADLTIF